MDNNLRFNVVRSNFGMTVEIFASQRTGDDNKLCVVLPAKLELQTFDFYTMAKSELPGPMLNFETEDAQRLADALFDAGFRPSDQTKATAQLGATERHLADMRALVEKMADVKLP